MSDLPSYQAHPDVDGWVNTVTLTEAWSEEPPPGVALDAALGRALMRTPAIVAHCAADGRISIPHDDRVLWQLLRASGRTGGEACGERPGCRALQDGYPDIPPGIALPAPISHRPDDEPSGVAFSEVPGLRWVPLRYEHLAPMAALAVETGLYPARCPDDPPCCRPPEAHAWMRLANRIDHSEAWQMVLEFNGQPLQFELVLVPPQRATISLTMHFTRERPHWFWREAERPIFEALRARGYQSVRARSRKDRPDWINALKGNYGAVEVQELETARILEFPLDLTRFQGWPARRTLQGWSWTRGPVVVREAVDEDLAALPAWITLAFPGHARRDLALRMLEEWVHLDRATVLLTLLDGAITDVRLVRHRRGVEASIAGLSPTRAPSAEREAAAAGFYAWCAAAGYRTVNMFVRESERAVLGPAYEARLARVGWQTVQTKSWTPGRPFREMRLDLAGARAILGGNP